MLLGGPGDVGGDCRVDAWGVEHFAADLDHEVEGFDVCGGACHRSIWWYSQMVHVVDLFLFKAMREFLVLAFIWQACLGCADDDDDSKLWMAAEAFVSWFCQRMHKQACSSCQRAMAGTVHMYAGVYAVNQLRACL